MYDVSYSVSLADDGELQVEETYAQGENTLEALHVLNAYHASETEVTIEAEKVLVGRDIEESDNYQFNLYYVERNGSEQLDQTAGITLTEDGRYDAQQVRSQMQAMLKSAKMDEQVYNFLKVQDNVDRITKACKDFGMTYDESTGNFYYVRKGKAVFGVDHDYIASLVCTGKASMDNLKGLLEMFLETAEFEAECTRVASGEDLLETRARPGRKRNNRVYHGSPCYIGKGQTPKN